MRTFDLTSPDRIVFGVGAEARTADTLAELGAQRVLFICSERRRAGADRIAAALGSRRAGVFTTDQPQVPQAVADAAAQAARDAGADWVVAHGGGTPVGVAKAVALQADVRVGAVVTTYAGSERTSIWGLTADGVKTTGRDDRVRPRLVVYDPELVLGLPRELSLQSLLNALAHSVEALYAETVTPDARKAAEDSLAPLLAGLRAVGEDPTDLHGRTESMYGAYLAANALNGASMALHHKLAHVLGGSLGTPHAATHATLLPYTLAFNLVGAPDAAAALKRAWSTEDPGALLYDTMRELGLKTTLASLELTLDDLHRAAALAVTQRYPNPRPVTEDSVQQLLMDGWHDRRPALDTTRIALRSTGTHTLDASAAGVPLADAEQVVIAVHGRGASADRLLADLRGHEDPPRTAWLAPMATGRSWYPKGFRAPLADNQPFLDDALAVLTAAYAAVRAHVEPERIVLVGFSQGACLLLTWLRASGERPGAVLAFSGAHTPVEGSFEALQGAWVHLSRSDGDPWVPAGAFAQTVSELTAAGADVRAHTVPGDLHRIHEPDVAALARALKR